MPISTDTAALERWVDANLLPLLVLAVVLAAIYALGSRLIHTAVHRAVRAQSGSVTDVAEIRDEIEKRASTLEGFAISMIRLVLIGLFVLILVGLLDLWGLVVVVGLVLALLTLAGQPIVLDYLMGTLVILEGQFFRGDWIRVGAIEGEVETVGLRRTVVRDTSGAVHTISNRALDVVTNETRVFATAEVIIPGVRLEDVDDVIRMMDEVGAQLDADPEWGPRIIEAPGYRLTSDFTDLGVTLVMRGKVRGSDRWVVPAEIRRRLTLAFMEHDVDLNLRGVEARIKRGRDQAASGVDGRP